MPECDFTPPAYKGPSLDECLEIRKANLFPGLVTFYKKPVLIHQGHKQWLFDHTGKRYLDFFAGIVTVSLGHAHEATTKALKDQADVLWHTTSIYPHPQIHQYAKELTDRMPGNLKVCMFFSSGTEANDLAVYLSRIHTGAYDVISLRNGYHGAGGTPWGLTATSVYRHVTPTGFGIHHAMNPDVFRGPWGGQSCRDSPSQAQRSCRCAPGECAASDKYADQLKDLMMHSTPKRIAGFFAEPIQGVGGTVQMPKGFLKKAADLVRERGGLVITDEVQTGFGRTGTHFWGFESHGIIPDIVTMAKGMGNGYPLAALVTTPEIASSLSKAVHFTTFGGSPLACAVGRSVLKAMDAEKTQDNCHKVGTYLLEQLMGLQREFPTWIGDVRGKGLMVGVEMVNGQGSIEKGSGRTCSIEPIPPQIMADIWEHTKDMGLLLGKGGVHGNVFRIKPPMCVTKQDVDFAISVFREAIKMSLPRL
ncbi:unnamed protein product [Notodromas monacha]|uniref:Alanine--glyoxylate aminotransferase 2, mitochondrial n=1 Tax=Notodromas monacha TaxID=399045 RepID=A0A7R9GHX3_9CRUS|nr:unnamed protein product [Notodromas monacha]CAG0921976.1 unnamed protein product [Notodromas monacha]